jgi:hypothetical protein
VFGSLCAPCVTCPLVLTCCLLTAEARAAAPVPVDDKLTRPAGATAKAIDTLLAQRWKTNGLRPAARTNDHEFLRRVTLDLLGRVATADELRAFVRDTRSDKRLRLIDRLLASPEFPDYWSEVWTDWLLPQRIAPADRDRLVGWIRSYFLRNSSYAVLTEKLLTASGKPSENGAVVFILAHLGQPFRPRRWKEEGQFDAAPLTDRVGQFFLATDLHCARCHAHPFNNKLNQKQFWGLNVFLRQIARVPAGRGEFLIRDDPSLNTERCVAYELPNGLVFETQAVLLDGYNSLGRDEKRSRRAVLARLLIDHPNFSRALVNRYWAHFFGRGLTELPVIDDFGEHNPFTHPALIDRLARDFDASGFDLKELSRAICASDAYQLQSSGGSRAAADDSSFHRMAVKPLAPKVRLRATLTALRADATLTAEPRRKLTRAWLDLIPPIEEDCEAHLNSPDRLTRYRRPADLRFESMRLLLSSAEVQAALAHPKGTVALALERGQPSAVLDELFLAAYNRPPAVAEARRLLRELAEPGRKDIDSAAWQDLFWVLLSSSAFAFNQ